MTVSIETNPFIGLTTVYAHMAKQNWRPITLFEVLSGGCSSLWLRQFQACSSPPPRGICRAFSNFSFPRVGHLLKEVSPGVGHCQSNVIFRILKDVHNRLFIIKFPDYPQYKNTKTELINAIWVDPALFK